MTLINNLWAGFVYIIKSLTNLCTGHLSFKDMSELTIYLKLSITVYTLSLCLLIWLIIINTLAQFFLTNNSSITKYLRLVNFFTITVMFNIILMKFVLTLRLENVLGMYVYPLKLEFYIINPQLTYLESSLTFSSAFGDAILLLSTIVGLLCIDLLGPKDMFKTISNINIFALFNFFVITMVTTNNLLVMFMSFEFIFLPTMYFAYMLGYSKKIDKSSELLFYWTLFGSFTVLVSLSYFYYKYGTLNYLYLTKKQFSNYEIMYMFLTIVIGFGVKIPIAPFHYWLLKVHVESPTAFSIFLSGFLVKSALYCIFMLLNIFKDNLLYILFMTWVLYSLIIGTWGLARQVDLKKLIAWATIQEMSFMLLFLVYKQLFFTSNCIIFLLLHGIMSTYMFYLVDVVQRRFKTRSIKLTMGLSVTCPKLVYYCWFLILLFSGFPLTVKFFLEWNLVTMFLTSNRILMIIVLFVVNLLGVIFFCKTIISLVYGSIDESTAKLELLDINLKERSILNFLIYLITVFSFLLYLI